MNLQKIPATFQFDKLINNHEFLKLTAAQIIKDFEMVNESLHPNFLHNNYKNMAIEIQKKVKFLLENNIHKLYRLLYRIDIDEKTIKKQLAKNQTLFPEVVISQLIIHREIQKVYFKIKYTIHNKS